MPPRIFNLLYWYMEQSMDIVIRYTSIDGASEKRKYKTLFAAREWARKLVGAHPDCGSYYAVSDDGIGKVTVEGAKLAEIFPDAS